jgi:hypothetical protein
VGEVSVPRDREQVPAAAAALPVFRAGASLVPPRGRTVRPQAAPVTLVGDGGGVTGVAAFAGNERVVVVVMVVVSIRGQLETTTTAESGNCVRCADDASATTTEARFEVLRLAAAASRTAVGKLLRHCTVHV